MTEKEEKVSEYLNQRIEIITSNLKNFNSKNFNSNNLTHHIKDLYIGALLELQTMLDAIKKIIED